MMRFIGDTVEFDFCENPNTGGVDELVAGTAFMILKP
jgi:hypothetical protein